MRLIISIIFIFTAIISIAQPKAEHNPKSFKDTDGTLYWNKELPVYIRISETPEGEGYLMKSKSTKEYTNPYYFDEEGENTIRTKYAVCKNTKEAIPQKIEVVWDLMVDGTAPKSNIDFKNAPKHKSSTMVYYGKNLKLDITTKDNLVGVESLFYSLDKKDYINVNGLVNVDTEGEHSIAVYGVDKVGNDEEPIIKTFIVDHSAPSTNHRIEGISHGNILAAQTKLILSSEDNYAGIENIYYTIDNGDEKKYTGKPINLQNINDGEHTMKYYAVDNVGNKEEVKSYDFYLDKFAPILAADILGDRFIVEDQIYFSGRTKLKLTAVDNKAGVKHVMFAIDSDNFEKYEQPFYLPSVAGIHIVKYFAEDNLENKTLDRHRTNERYQKYMHNVSKVYVDLTGPTLGYDFIGPHMQMRDTFIINTKTKIKIKATDAESGFQYSSYSIDGELEETKYTEPFSIEEDGFHEVECFAYDNVNNRNKNIFGLIVDNIPPDINYYFSVTPIGRENGYDVFPDYVQLFLSATDKLVGTRNIYVAVNGGKYEQYFRGFKKFERGKLNKIKIKAIDNLDNVKEKEITVFIK